MARGGIWGSDATVYKNQTLARTSCSRDLEEWIAAQCKEWPELFGKGPIDPKSGRCQFYPRGGA